MKHYGSFVLLGLLILLGSCLPVGSIFCQSSDEEAHSTQIKCLVLTDGTVEPIRQYSIQSDRVRYFSTERHAWEELPYSMVDWVATEAYAHKAANESTDRLNAERAKADEELIQKNARFPLVAPGLRLPYSDGVFMLDVYQGKSQLVSLVQSESDLNKNTKGNILRGVLNPVASSNQTVELKGLHAQIQAHDPLPAFYYPLDTADSNPDFNAESAKDRFRIVRCNYRKDNRVLTVHKIAVYGKVTQQTQYVETRVEKVSDYWVKIVPLFPLQTAEYAFVELDEKGSMNLYVWDFGRNPDAPPNPSIEPEDKGIKTPVLLQIPSPKANP